MGAVNPKDGEVIEYINSEGEHLGIDDWLLRGEPIKCLALHGRPRPDGSGQQARVFLDSGTRQWLIGQLVAFGIGRLTEELAAAEANYTVAATELQKSGQIFCSPTCTPEEAGQHKKNIGRHDKAYSERAHAKHVLDVVKEAASYL